MHKKKRFPMSRFELYLILTLIVGFSFLAIHPIVGIMVSVLVWISYKSICKQFLTEERTLEITTVNEDTKKLIDTIVSEQASVEKKPFYDLTCPIHRGSLPAHIHNVLDEMEITTWGQLSLFDEKELLYKKCFGEEALRKIKSELAERGLALNSSKNHT